MLLNIICIVLLFGLLIFAHELGHFILAKINNVKVEEFSIGMGPKIISKKGKETVYSLRALPIGGYNKFLGDEGECDDPRALINKPPLRKLSVIIAGPLMNLVLAVILLATVKMVTGNYVNVINEVQKNSPASKYGIVSGDKILSINDKKINDWSDVQTAILDSKTSELDFNVSRNNEQKNLKIISEKKDGNNFVGITPKAVTPNIFSAIGTGFSDTGNIIKLTFQTLCHFSIQDVGGPVSIFKISGKVAQTGLINLVWLMSYISIQLAIFNIIPFPALDGGYIVIYLFELISRKHVDIKKVGTVNYIGFILLLALMVVVTIKDIIYPIKF